MREACEKKGLAVSALLEQLEAELQCNASPTENPADLPVMQSSKFVFAINMKTASLLGIDVRRISLVLADKVID